MSKVAPSIEVVHETLARATGRMSIMLGINRFSASWIRECAADVAAAHEVMKSIIERMDEAKKEQAAQAAPTPPDPTPDPPKRTRTRVRR